MYVSRVCSCIFCMYTACIKSVPMAVCIQYVYSVYQEYTLDYVYTVCSLYVTIYQKNTLSYVYTVYMQCA